MKLSVSELEGQQPLANGWVEGLVQKPGVKNVTWSYEIFVEDIPDDTDELWLQVEQRDYLALGLIPRKRVLGKPIRLSVEEQLVKTDKPRTAASEIQTVTVPRWGRSELLVAISAPGTPRRQRAQIYLISSTYSFGAYSVLVIVPLLVILWRWRIISGIFILPDEGSRGVLSGLVAWIVSLVAGGTLIKGLDVAADIFKRLKEQPQQALAAKRTLLSQPAVYAMIILVLGVVAPPLLIYRIENTKEGKPRPAGYTAAFETSKTAYFFKWFSGWRLDGGEENFAYLPRGAAEPCAQGRFSFLDPEPKCIGCNDARKWEDFKLIYDEDNCKLEETQRFKKELALEPGKDIVLPSKPFGGMAGWNIDGGRGNLECYAGKGANVTLLRFADTSTSIAQLKIQCKRDDIGDGYQLISNFRSDTSGSPYACIPSDCQDFRLALAWQADVKSLKPKLPLPDDLVREKSISIGESACSWASEAVHTTLGSLHMKTGPLEFIEFKAGGCTAIEEDQQGEFEVLVRGKDAEMTLENIKVGMHFSFSAGLLSEVTIKDRHNAQESSKVTCGEKKDMLLLVNTESVKDVASGLQLGEDKIASIALKQRAGRKVFEQKAAWICMESSGVEIENGSKKREEQCLNSARDGHAKPAARTYWIDMDTYTVQHCHPPKPQCCFVCGQYYANVGKSPVLLVDGCGSSHNGLVSLPMERCAGVAQKRGSCF